MRKIVRFFLGLCARFSVLAYGRYSAISCGPIPLIASNVRHARKTYWNIFVLNKSYLDTPIFVYGYAKKSIRTKLLTVKNKTVRGVCVRG